MKNLHTYYVAEGYDVEQFNAGVVRNDNERILDKEGFIALKFSYVKVGSLPVKLLRFINTIQLAFSVKKNSLVFFHFPLLANAYKWLLQILKWRGIKTVTLINDIDGIRDKDELLLKEEINILQQFTYIIVHNSAMKNKLLPYLPGAKLFSIELFDYPFKGLRLQRQLSNAICFAGNIAKSKFIYRLDQLTGVQVNVYGVGYNALLNIKEHFIYKGIFSPAALPAELEGSFGLVWDGDSIKTCDDYLRYNNPHKLSLYLVAGLPVIVWEKSAVASFVKENNIGFTINSITDIGVKLNALSPAGYEFMRQKVLLFGEQISKGFFLKKVITEIKNLQNQILPFTTDE